ncbi:hypothetical protein SUGI_0312340 [Cryptomeria japonica]|nr:hypothetical protein SUGI_0312340 [Cryptomeria japonica]
MDLFITILFASYTGILEPTDSPGQATISVIHKEIGAKTILEAIITSVTHKNIYVTSTSISNFMDYIFFPQDTFHLKEIWSCRDNGEGNKFVCASSTALSRLPFRITIGRCG